MTAHDCDLAVLSDTAGPVSSRIVEVDGIPMSGLLTTVRQPRAVIVALHGGAANSYYFDCPQRPWLSLLRTAATIGFTVLALDRPGYGASAQHADRMTSARTRVDLGYAAIAAHLGQLPRGAGVFVMAHSMGCELAMRMAADDRGRELLGLEVAGTGRQHHRVAADMAAEFWNDPKARRTTGLRKLLWEPANLYPDDVIGGAMIGSRAPAYEGSVARTWQTDFADIAAKIRVPVQYTLADHEMVWQSGPTGFADIASLFTASPRVTVNEQASSGHNLSIGLSAMAYHLRVLSFVEECVLAREQRVEGG